MRKYLCAIAVQKIQSFLFDALQSHEQEKQKDEYTLKKVFYASQTVSEKFRKKVLCQFGERMLKVSPCVEHPTSIPQLIPSGSGMALFVIEMDGSENQKTDFGQELQAFFCNDYYKYQAHMRVAYTFRELPAGCYDYADETVKLKDEALVEIVQIKKDLLSSGNGNEMIKSHQ
ncbi:MAG: hypothetical protein LBL15_07710, partial [Oscillospiraceae bacterium]|nr:hypothetical protein [Oscillospiraceae bacterium]